MTLQSRAWYSHRRNTWLQFWWCRGASRRRGWGRGVRSTGERGLERGARPSPGKKWIFHLKWRVSVNSEQPFYSWEGNRRSGVALAMHQRRQWFIHLRAQWLTRRRWTPRLHSSKEYGTALPLPYFKLWGLVPPVFPDLHPWISLLAPFQLILAGVTGFFCANAKQ